MEVRGNSPTYPAQYAELFHYFRSAAALFDRDCLFAAASTTFEDR